VTGIAVAPTNSYIQKIMSAKNGNGKDKVKGVFPSPDGRPSKATPEKIQAILDDIALGLTEEQACAANDVHQTTWIDWKNNTDKFPELRERAKARRIKALLKQMEEAREQKLDWREPAWKLERTTKGQFADPAKAALNVQQNNTFMISREEGRAIDAQVARIMPEVDKLLEEHALDEIEGPAVYDHPPSQAPHEHKLLENAREQVAPHLIRASDVDSLGRVEKSPEPEHVRQRDKKPLAGPLSARQMRLEQDRRMGRADGDGKRPF
jgi:hypothetical protein